MSMLGDDDDILDMQELQDQARTLPALDANEECPERPKKRRRKNEVELLAFYDWTPTDSGIAFELPHYKSQESKEEEDGESKEEEDNGGGQSRIEKKEFETTCTTGLESRGRGGVQSRSEKILVFYNARRIKDVNGEPIEIVSTEREAVFFEFKVGASTYRIATAHAPYRNADNTATTYFSKLREMAKEKKCDIIIGDLNLYSQNASSKRSAFHELPTPATSRGGSRLDRIFVTKEFAGSQCGMPNSKNPAQIEADPDSVVLVSWNMQGRGMYNEKTIPEWMNQTKCDVLIALEPNNDYKEEAEVRGRTQRGAALEGEAKRRNDQGSDHEPLYIVLPPRSGRSGA